MDTTIQTVALLHRPRAGAAIRTFGLTLFEGPRAGAGPAHAIGRRARALVRHSDDLLAVHQVAPLIVLLFHLHRLSPVPERAFIVVSTVVSTMFIA